VTAIPTPTVSTSVARVTPLPINCMAAVVAPVGWGVIPRDYVRANLYITRTLSRTLYIETTEAHDLYIEQVQTASLEL
jgi:hypothetical protein